MSTKKKFIPTVSVIIPMYNVEEYIGECLQSLLKQTLKDIEVIVVDDCSTDKSADIAEKFQQIFKERLLLVKLQRNIGYPGLPRNLAMQQAHGKYIYFLDSDDFIKETALEEFYKVAEEFKADVVHSEKSYLYEGDGKITVDSFQAGGFVEEPTLETFDTGKRVTDFIQKKYMWWACNKLFRREFLEENKITFPKMTSFEDYVFAFQCVVAAKNYVRVPFVSYYYRIRENSLSHGKRYTAEDIRNMAEAVRAMDKFMRGREFFKDNPSYRYDVIDFFVQWRIDVVSKSVFGQDFKLPEIYAILQEHSFSNSAEDNSALEAYLFVTAGIYKLFMQHQSDKIAQLQEQIRSKEE